MAKLTWQLIESKYTAPTVNPVYLQNNIPTIIRNATDTAYNATEQATAVLNRIPNQVNTDNFNVQPMQMAVQNVNNPIPEATLKDAVKGLPSKQSINNIQLGNPSDEFIQKAIYYGNKYGIEPEVFLTKAQIESSFRPDAGKARKSAYGGLFGLSRKDFGDKIYNSDFAFEEVARQYQERYKYLQQKGLKNPTIGDVYVNHQQGNNGWSALYFGGDALAGEVLNPYYGPKYNKYANLGIVGGYQPVFQNLTGTPEERAAKAKKMTSREFYNFWADKANKVYNAWKTSDRLVKFRK